MFSLIIAAIVRDSYRNRATDEGLVNHLIHRDYTVMGGEVHIDIYDNRVELVSPGAMLDGTQIQDRDIYRPLAAPQPGDCRRLYPTRLYGEAWLWPAQDA